MSVERKEVWVLRGTKYVCWEEGCMSVERMEVWVLRGRKYECWEEGSMSAERKEVWVLRGRKYECWEEGSISVERKEVWVLSGRSYEFWFYKKRRTLQHWELISASRYKHYKCCPNIGLHRCNMFKSEYYQNTYPCTWTDYLLLQKAGSFSNL